MLNQCQFIGHLGADPDIRRTQDGRPIANLSLAVTESWRDKNSGERKEKTEWVRVVIFSEGLCKVAESYLKKGSKIFIAGKMQTRKWTDKDGNDKWSTEIVLQGFDSKLVMLDGKSEGGENNRNQEQQNNHGGGFGGGGDLDDEIPFSPEFRV